MAWLGAHGRMARRRARRDDDEARGHPPHQRDHRRRARQRRVLHGRDRPADGQADRQPGRTEHVPPVLRRRARLAGDGPDVLRVPGRGARRRAGAGMVHRIVWRVVLGARRSSSGASAWRRTAWSARADGRQPAVPRPGGPGTRAGDQRRRGRAAERASRPEIPREHALQGFEGVRAYSNAPGAQRAPARRGDGLHARRGGALGGARRAPGRLLRVRPGAAGDQPHAGRGHGSPRGVRLR